MRSCFLSLILFVLMIVGFIVGALGNQSGLMVASILAAPLVWFIGGWSAKGLFAGRRLTFVEAEPTRTESMIRRHSRQNVAASDTRTVESL